MESINIKRSSPSFGRIKKEFCIINCWNQDKLFMYNVPVNNWLFLNTLEEKNPFLRSYIAILLYHKFCVQDIEFIKSNISSWKCVECVLILEFSRVNLHLGSYNISLFLTKLLLIQYRIFKKKLAIKMNKKRNRKLN